MTHCKEKDRRRDVVAGSEVSREQLERWSYEPRHGQALVQVGDVGAAVAGGQWKLRACMRQSHNTRVACMHAHPRSRVAKALESVRAHTPQVANLVRLPNAPASPLRSCFERTQRNNLGAPLLHALAAAINAAQLSLGAHDRDALFAYALGSDGPTRVEALARWAMVSKPRRDAVGAWARGRQ